MSAKPKFRIATPEESAQGAQALAKADMPKVLTTFAAFMGNMAPPDEVIDGLLPTGRAFSLTGPPGAGKTTLGTLIAACVATGRSFAGREVKRGRVLYLCGESDHDLRLHFAATMATLGVTQADCEALTIRDGTLHLRGDFVDLEDDIKRIGDLALVIIDTEAAFFTGDSDIDTVQRRDHARDIRALTTLPGGPAVIALSHPKASAMRDDLVPRGAGAFLAELDGNFSLWPENETVVRLHHSRKFRAAPFEPIEFELRPIALDGIVDSKGRKVYSVAAVHVTDDDADAMRKQFGEEAHRLLHDLFHNETSTRTERAARCGMRNKESVRSIMRSLERQGLAEVDSLTGADRLTKKGREYAKRIK